MKRRPGILVAVVTLAVFLGASLLSNAPAKERKVIVSPSQLPPKISSAIQEAFPKGKIVGIEKEVEGEDVGQFDVEIRSGGKDYDVEVSKEGKVIETKERARKKKASGQPEKKWTKNFHMANRAFSSTGMNRYFVLKPGCQLVLENEDEKVEINVLNETVTVGGIETRVVEERESKKGNLKEVSKNFYAIDKNTGDVFYFGEEVDNYRNGKIVKHSGQWRADNKDSQAGVMMPGTIYLGARHYQEIAPNALDRAEIISDDVTLKTPAGTFKHCLRVEETSGLNAREKCYKTYAPGIGVIQDEDLLLTHYDLGQNG